MKKEREAWRDIADIASAGFGDFVESMLICLIIFIFFALFGFMGNFELYANIMKKIAWAVISTSLGVRMSSEIKNRTFTICIYMLIVINIAVSVIMVVLNILS